MAVAQRLTDRGVPFAFYTGQANVETLSAKWPDCKVLAKPVRPQALIKAVADLLRRDLTSA